jgi:hypothetical protein
VSNELTTEDMEAARRTLDEAGIELADTHREEIARLHAALEAVTDYAQKLAQENGRLRDQLSAVRRGQ